MDYEDNNDQENNEKIVPIKKGRPKTKAPVRERITGMPVQARDFKEPRRMNSKPQREVDSMSRGRYQSRDCRWRHGSGTNARVA